MKTSLITLAFFTIGILFGFYRMMPSQIIESDLSTYVLYILMFLLGIAVGGDRKTWITLREANFKILLIPLIVVLGSFLGVSICSLFLRTININEALAVGAGFGYYSLSSIIITKFHSETLGVIALLANIMREIFTLLLAPLLAKYFGKIAPIAAGGATSMDTTLPIITKSVGKHFAIISVFTGVVLSVLVPFLVTFLIK